MIRTLVSGREAAIADLAQAILELSHLITLGVLGRDAAARR